MHTSQHRTLGNDWCVTALTCQVPLHDINMQSAKEALFKMFTDQSTGKKKYIWYFLQRGDFVSTSIAGKKKTGNQTLMSKRWWQLKMSKKKKKNSISGELILRPLLSLSAPSFHLPHHFVTVWNQGSSTFNRSNLGMSCKSVHCSVLGFAVS